MKIFDKSTEKKRKGKGKMKELEEGAIVETTTVKKIRRALDNTLKNSQMGFIFGQTGRGKTYAAKDWMKSHPEAVYLRIDSGITLARLRREMSYLLFGHEGAALREIAAEIAGRRDFLLIVDEAAHLFSENSTSRTARNLDFIRDIFDRVNENGGRCGVCFIFTDCDIRKLTCGQMAGFLGQFVGRMENHLDIPSKISRAYEINPVLRAYGLPDSFQETAHRIACGSGRMRTLYKCLGLGLKASKRIGKEITPEFLQSVADQIMTGRFPDE